ncbi:MAG: GTP-binding protein, partial [Pseudomonadota bacterium]
KAEEIDRLIAILKTLNTDARIIPIAKGEVETDAVLSTGLFDFARAQQAPGWLKEMRGEHVPETEEYGIGSFSYQARRPFHPEKFHQFLHKTEGYGKLIRSKGYFWLASRPEFAGQWSQAGGIARYGFAGMFWKAVPQEHWPTDHDAIAFIKQHWEEPFGDMRQELVFIGQGLDQEKITQALDKCLLTGEEVLRGKAYWKTLNDPFPAWGDEE